MSSLCLTTSEIGDLFTEEIKLQSGQVTDTFNDGLRLFTRSVLPQLDEVRPKDSVQNGVALKATPAEICVYPYVFREVCRNGAIMAHSQQGQRLVFSDDETSEDTASAIREAIGACCRDEVFATSVKEIRSSVGTDVDLALTLLPHISQLSQGPSKHIIAVMLERFFGDGDSSRFGLMNAVTSVARDTTDPEDRWRMEELGGGIAAAIRPQPPADAPGVQVEHFEAAALG